MSLKGFGKSIEKRALRPFFQRVKAMIRAARGVDRISALEARVELLESLFREQAGLHYLRLLDDGDSASETSSGDRQIA